MNSLSFASAIIGLGASLGLFRIAWASPSGQRNPWILSGLISLLGALIGARLFFVLEHLSFFSIHPGDVLQFWLGGLSWPGALAGAVAIIPLSARIWQWKFSDLLDRVSLIVLPLAVSAWLACWLSGTAYGQPLPEGSWWGITVMDEAGQMALRNPVQPLAALSMITFIGFLEYMSGKIQTSGLKGISICLVFCADMLLFSFLRADPAPIWHGLRIETWAAIVYTLMGIIAVIWVTSNKKIIIFYQNVMKVFKARKKTA